MSLRLSSTSSLSYCALLLALNMLDIVSRSFRNWSIVGRQLLTVLVQPALLKMASMCSWLFFNVVSR
jgi:hypothetical protein